MTINIWLAMISTVLSIDISWGNFDETLFKNFTNDLGIDNMLTKSEFDDLNTSTNYTPETNEEI